MTADPAEDATLTLPDGRTLAYASFGPADGEVVVLLHGGPGSRLACPDIDAVDAAGVRLLTFDRPGYGRSDPLPFHHLGVVANDLVALCDALDIERCPVLGWSAGGVYALACAALHPERFPALALVSASGAPDDPDVVAGSSPEVAALVDALRSGSDAALAEVAQRFDWYAQDPATIHARTLADEADPDRHVMARPDAAVALTAMWREGARQGTAGLAAGWAAQWALPWGFAIEDVRVPTTSWHGTGDVVVPFPLAERLAARMPQARLHAFDGEGHLVALDHFTAILTTVRADAAP